LNKLK